jgi:hypothetical protein
VIFCRPTFNGGLVEPYSSSVEFILSLSKPARLSRSGGDHSLVRSELLWSMVNGQWSIEAVNFFVFFHSSLIITIPQHKCATQQKFIVILQLAT